MKDNGTPLEAVNDQGDPRDRAFWLREIQEQSEALGLEWSAREAARQGKKASWLAQYARTATRYIACGAAGVSLTTIKKWETEDPIFAAMVPLAKSAMSDLLVSEARRRAVDGVSVTKYDKNGHPLYEETTYSDSLLMFLLKGTDYEKRWAQKADLSQVSEETWRSAFAAAIRDDPDALAALDRLADKMVAGEG